MKKLLLTLGLTSVFTISQAQNPVFGKCEKCPAGREAVLTTDNLVEMYLTSQDNIRLILEKNGYTTEVQPGFCANFFLKKEGEAVDLIYKRCAEYFQVSQESGTKLEELIKTMKPNFMRENNTEKWYSIAYKSKRYKFIVADVKGKTTLKVTSF